MTLEIFGFARSNFVRAVRMVAEEKGIAYELIQEMPHSDAINALSPTGKIPALRHDGLELSESLAIANYIDDAFDGPKLAPDDTKGAAKVNQWTAFVATEVDQLVMRNYVVEYAFHKDKDGNVVRTKIDKAIKRFPKMFGMIEAGLADGYLGGGKFTMADCFLAPILNAAYNFPEGKAAIDASPTISAYMAKLKARPSFQATAS